MDTSKTSEFAAQQLLSQYWNGSTPVPVEQLARHANVHVQKKQLSDNESRGVLQRLQDGTVQSWLPVGQPETVNRFVLAHQVGHVLLGHLPRGLESTLPESRSTLSRVDSSMDGQANRFALCLLLPENALRYAIHGKSAPDLTRLCELFLVSPAAMHRRLYDLRILRD